MSKLKVFEQTKEITDKSRELLERIKAAQLLINDQVMALRKLEAEVAKAKEEERKRLQAEAARLKKAAEAEAAAAVRQQEAPQEASEQAARSVAAESKQETKQPEVAERPERTAEHTEKPRQDDISQARPAAEVRRPKPSPAAGAGAAPAAKPAAKAPFGQKKREDVKPLPAGFMPTVEKERVSNYDPNKSVYAKERDAAERKTKSKKSITKELARVSMDIDDERMAFKKPRRAKQPEKRQQIEPIKIERAVMTGNTITVKELAEKIGKPAAAIIKQLFLLGIIATINQEIDFDTSSLVASEFGVTLEQRFDKTYEEVLIDEDKEDREEDLVPRNPVVTIMGHVDHGKTTLLDYIRNTRVAAGEAGGITQHIGAYTIEVQGKGITFLDTPGHEAFTTMRARGAQVTDVAILVVAADDGVKPQTVEAINHAKAAKVPIIVAINKIDKPAADVERTKQMLAEYELLPEEWGGDTIMVPVSALTGENVDKLLEMILLVSEVQELKANPNRLAKGTVIETRLDKGRGPIATVLVQNGTLRPGDTVVAGTAYGHVRAMMNDRGERVEAAGPSMPVEVIGFSQVPEAGDILYAVQEDKLSRQVAEERREKQKAEQLKTLAKVSLTDFFSKMAEGQVKELNIIIKADVQGSAEALKTALEKLSNDEVRIRTIHSAVGAITESDVMLASASGAIIIGFNVRPEGKAREAAEDEGIDVRLYRIIYNAIEDMEKAMKGLLEPVFVENVIGHAEVRNIFRVSGVGTVAGCYVQDGKVTRNAMVRLVRDGVTIYEGKVGSLKRFKNDAREVAAGYECGMSIENFNDIKEGDIIEAYVKEEVKQHL